MKVVAIWATVLIAVFSVSMGWIFLSPVVNNFFDAIDAECQPNMSGMALTTYTTVVSVGKITFNLSPVVIIVAVLLWGYAKTQQKERVTEFVYR